MIDQFQIGMVVFEVEGSRGHLRAARRHAAQGYVLTVGLGLQQHHVEDVIVGHSALLGRPQRRQFDHLRQQQRHLLLPALSIFPKKIILLPDWALNRYINSYINRYISSYKQL